MKDSTVRYFVQTTWGVMVGEFLGDTVDGSGFIFYVGDAVQYVRWTDFVGAAPIGN